MYARQAAQMPNQWEQLAPLCPRCGKPLVPVNGIFYERSSSSAEGESGSSRDHLRIFPRPSITLPVWRCGPCNFDELRLDEP
jgi:hypothetical protein